ncbi:hypothetical protein [Planomonospora sphaerica]|uniref:hypothetical protein n=1 Tax=Planomonospora sphaerica TaxID=161355 RepID=UPI00128FF337|nr:hypothetical protein [Planomonospora sphaerica]
MQIIELLASLVQPASPGTDLYVGLTLAVKAHRRACRHPALPTPQPPTAGHRRQERRQEAGEEQLIAQR